MYIMNDWLYQILLKNTASSTNGPSSMNTEEVEEIRVFVRHRQSEH